MKIKLNKEIFLEKLITASHFCLSRISSNSSLQGALLKIENKKIKIITTNLSEFFYTEIDIENDGSKKIVIDIKKIIEFLNFITSSFIELDIEDKKITIISDKTKGSFNLISSEDFPEPSEIKGEEFSIEKNFLKEKLPLVLFSVAKDESRPVLTSINFSIKNDTKYLVSTDGFRLSLLKADKSINLEGNISADVLNETLLMLEKQKEVKVVFDLEKKIVLFKIGDNFIYSSLIEGDFPPFERVIPDGFKTKIVIDRDEFLRNIKLNSIFARDFSNIVIFDIKKEGLYIRPKVKEEGNMVTHQEIDFEGEEQKISFNYKFILDFLSNIKEKKIVFEMMNKNAPGIFKSDKNDSYIHIIMPVRIDDEEV